MAQQERYQDLIRISRYISMLLRHKPEAAGISVDKYGWANVEELIRGVSKTHVLDMALLEVIVATDDKKRYSFNEDKTKIRANQGHSIDIDVELEERKPPEYLWHGTGMKYVESIKKEGLIPKSRQYVHLSSDYETAVDVGKRHGQAYVFKVHSEKMFEDGFLFYQSVNGVWQTKAVPCLYLEEGNQDALPSVAVHKNA